MKLAAGPLLKVTVAVPAAVPSALVAFMVTCAGVMVAGAVYRPVVEILPAGALAGLTALIDQLTVWLEVAVTVAVNCFCWLALKLTLDGLTVTVSVPGLTASRLPLSSTARLRTFKVPE